MKHKVAAVLSGDRVDNLWLNCWLSQADIILAADGGADLVMRAGFAPDLVIGDLDSVTEEALANARDVVRIDDQNCSDCDKLLGYLNAEKIGGAVLLGAEGDRVDHMLGALQSIARIRGHVQIAYRHQLARVLLGPCSSIITCEGLISTLPLARCDGVSITNVTWPVSEATMDVPGFSSLSNNGLGPVEIGLRTGALAVFWDYDGKPVWPSG